MIHFDYIKHNGTIHTLMLRKHYYDMIVASTPVFIRPTFDYDGNGIKDMEEKSEFVFNNVTLEYFDDSDLDRVSNHQKQSGEMVSSFNKGEIKNMGVYLSGNKFYQNMLPGNKTIDIKPLRGWINTTDAISTNAKMTNVMGGELDFEDDVQGIDFIEIDDGNSITTYSNSNIYNLDGQKVGSSFTDMNSLPNGVYIVNGKKYTVKNK